MADNDESKPLGSGAWRARISASRSMRKDLLKVWQDNVSYRLGKPFKSQPTEDTVNVPADWSRTKNKQAQLWFQVPEVFVEARQKPFAPVATVFGAALNFRLTEEMHVEHVMNECLGDVINAAGIMIAKVGYEATFETVMMPQQQPLSGMAPEAGAGPMPPPPMPDAGAAMPGMPPPGGGLPPDAAAMMGGATEGVAPPAPPMVPVQRPIYQCYYAKRLSPAHFLWPTEFVGSNWQEAQWLGWDGYVTVAEAIRNKWVEADFEGTTIDAEEWLMVKDNTDQKPQDGMVKFSEIFYKPFYFDPAVQDNRKIKRLVIVEGKDGKGGGVVVDEDFQWQRFDQQARTWVGMTTFPIKVGCLAHISDKAIPPSDSEAGRPQVRELIRSRSQQIKQRDHSMPLRWFDVNQVDDEIADRLRKGKYQDMIPMNGPGDHAIGEVARAAYPRESWEFDKVIKQDLDEAWSMGAPQMSQPTGGDTTATEIKSLEGSMNVRLSFEQGWVGRFFLEIAQATGQMMQLFDDDELLVNVVGPDGLKTLQMWHKNVVPCECLFKFKQDSQLKLDVNAERTMSLNLYKLLRQDSLINPTALVGEVLEKHNIDPTKVLVPPSPPKHETPKISYSFKGEDMNNPMVIALMQKKDDSPVTAEDIAAAKQLLEAASQLEMPPPPLQPPLGGMAPPSAVGAEHGGPAPKVEELGRRYEHAGTNIAGSRDSGLPEG
jgi:hypothetical protein